MPVENLALYLTALYTLVESVASLYTTKLCATAEIIFGIGQTLGIKSCAILEMLLCTKSVPEFSLPRESAKI